MKVILLQDVKGSGKKGDVIEAKDGFAKNFLLKKGFAVIADAQNLNDNTNQKAAAEYRIEQQKKANRELKEKLNGTVVEITVKSGENGKFFGSVTAKEIAEKLADAGFLVDKKKIVLIGKKFFEGLNAQYEQLYNSGLIKCKPEELYSIVDSECKTVLLHITDHDSVYLIEHILYAHG